MKLSIPVLCIALSFISDSGFNKVSAYPSSDIRYLSQSRHARIAARDLRVDIAATRKKLVPRAPITGDKKKEKLNDLAKQLGNLRVSDGFVPQEGPSRQAQGQAAAGNHPTQGQASGQNLAVGARPNPAPSLRSQRSRTNLQQQLNQNPQSLTVVPPARASGQSQGQAGHQHQGGGGLGVAVQPGLIRRPSNLALKSTALAVQEFDKTLAGPQQQPGLMDQRRAEEARRENSRKLTQASSAIAAIEDENRGTMEVRREMKDELNRMQAENQASSSKAAQQSQVAASVSGTQTIEKTAVRIMQPGPLEEAAIRMGEARERKERKAQQGQRSEGEGQ